MSPFDQFFIGPFLEWAPSFVWIVVIFYAAFRYVMERGEENSRGSFFMRFSYRQLAWAVIFFHLFYAACSMWGQYLVWRTSRFTESFLEFPLASIVASSFTDLFPGIFKSKLGYFLFYSLGHFWALALLSVLAAVVLRAYLRWLEKRNERFFFEGEVNLGFLCALVVGWPRVILFIPLLFLLMLALSLYKMVMSQGHYTTFGYPFLIALVLTFVLWTPLNAVLPLAQLTP